MHQPAEVQPAGQHRAQLLVRAPGMGTLEAATARSETNVMEALLERY
jgi:hypothetical protein